MDRGETAVEREHMTNAQFVMQVCYLAKEACAWAGDTAGYRQDQAAVISPDDVARFTAGVRKRLTRIEEWAGVAALRSADTGRAEAMREACSNYIRERLSKLTVVEIDIREHNSVDGDRIEITIACNDAPSTIAAAEPAGFIHGLRRLLADLGIDGFPLVSFRAIARALPTQTDGGARG